MAPTLYFVHASPPVRAVLITAKAIGLELNEKQVDLLAGETRTPEYLKMNPQHSVPTLKDDNLVICDSHAIVTYIVAQYAKTDALYPKDLKKRAIVDQRLHFDTGVVFPRMRSITFPMVFFGKKTIEEEAKNNVIEAFEFLEKFLEGNEWVAGDFLSVADYSLISSISSINSLVPVDEKKFPSVRKWMKKMENLPEYEANRNGLQDFKDLLGSKLGKKID